MQIATTERLVLRHFTEEDAPFVLRILQSAGFLQYIGDRGVKNLHDAVQYIKDKFLKPYASLGFGMYAIELKEGGIAIGMAGLVKRDHLTHADLGYALLPEYGGQGFAQEAASAVIKFTRETLQLDTLLAIVTPNNRSSIRLLEKLGFKFEKEIIQNDETLLLFKKQLLVT